MFTIRTHRSERQPVIEVDAQAAPGRGFCGAFEAADVSGSPGPEIAGTAAGCLTGTAYPV